MFQPSKLFGEEEESGLTITQRYQQILRRIEDQLQCKIRDQVADSFCFIIEELNQSEIVNLGIHIYPYLSIKNLTLTFKCYMKGKDHANQFELLAQLLNKLCKIDHLNIQKYSSTVSTMDIITILKEVQYGHQINRLSIDLKYTKEHQESEFEYNLKLFGQEIGYFSHLNELNLKINSLEITEDSIFNMFQGIKECIYLQKLSINVQLSKNYIKEIIVLKDILLQAQSIQELSLEFSNLYDFYQAKIQFQEIMVGLKNLEKISIHIIVDENYTKEEEKFCQKMDLEEQQITGSKIKSFEFKVVFKKRQCHVNIEQMNIYLLSICEDLVNINIDVSSCNSFELANFFHVIQNYKNLKSLEMKVNLINSNLIELTEYRNSIKDLKNLEKMKIEICKGNIQSLESVNKICQLFTNCQNLKELTLNLVYNLLNPDMFNLLSQELSKCSLLQTLLINIGLQQVLSMNVKQFSQQIRKLEQLRILIFDFTVKKKEKYFKKIKLGDRAVRRYYCGTYLLGIAQEKRNSLQNISQFKAQIQRALRRNVRLIKADCLCENLYSSYQDQENYSEFYSYFQMHRGEDDDDSDEV